MAEKDFELIEEIIRPEIFLDNSDNEAIVYITVKSNIELQYITYQWEGREGVKINAMDPDKNEIKTELSIPIGDSNITVYAIDIEGNEHMEKKFYKTTVKPTVGMVQEGGILKITAKDPKELSYIIITINGVENRVDAEAGATTMTYNQTLDVGENEVMVIVYNSDNQTKQYESRYEYNPD